MKFLKSVNAFRFYLALFICLGLLLPLQAGAREFQIYGIRALGMGGAGVAAVRDATAIYWNPAVQGYFNNREDDELKKEYPKGGGSFNFQVGVQQFEAFGDLYTQIEDLDIEEIMDGPADYLFPGGLGTIPDFEHMVQYGEVISTLTEFLTNNPGVDVSLVSGIIGNYGNYGLGIIGFGEVSSTVSPDLDNIGIYDTNADRVTTVAALSVATGGATGFFSPAERAQLAQTISNYSLWTPTGAANYVNTADSAFFGAGGIDKADAKEAITLFAQAVSAESFENNESAIVGQGAVIGEIPLSYGYAINQYLSVGANLKFIYAYTYSTRITLDEAEDGDYIEEVIDNTDTAYSFGIDLGIYCRWKQLRAGLLARNLNAPSFDFPSPVGVPEPVDALMKTSFRLEPQIRLGLAYLPFDSLVLAVDVDLTGNETFFGQLPGGGDHTSQNVSFGLEWTPIDFLSLRAGCYRNMQSDSIPIVLTGGLGLNLWALHLEIGAASSTAQDEIEEVAYPTAANVGLSFSLSF